MSLHLSRQVNSENPHLLQANVGATCYAFTLKLIDKLRAEGHEAYSMCKSPGEGQYVPPGFQLRDVIGLDGNTYRCSGVSHDAIWCDGKQFDTISSANDEEHPIFTDSGAQIVGQPVWNEIPERFWRPQNPPLKDAVAPPAPPPPRIPILPKGEAFARLKALDAFYRAPEGLQRPEGIGGDMEAIAQWFYQMVIEGVSLEDVFTQIRASHEWQSKHP